MLAVAVWEFCRPRRQREFPALRRRLGNLGIWILNLILAAFVFAPTDTFRPQLEAVLGVTLPSWPIAEGWASLAAAFLLLDLLRYLVHRCKHAVPFLWSFHALHHSDPDVDVTTSVRLHPIEFLFNSGVFWVTAILLGIPATVGLTYGFTTFAVEAVQHGNIRLPERLTAGCSGCWSPPTCTASTTPSRSRKGAAITQPFSLSGIGFSGPTRG